MVDKARCSKCNGPLDAGGACPACLLQLALDTPSRVEPLRADAHEAGVRAEGPPPEIPSYRITRTLGEGGMGIVYLAEQTEPVRRQVALKVIRSGLDTREVVARFEAERQALARLDHPAIARVYDAGQTADGRPWFAMEYVDGERITDHCDRLRLGTGERLELFVQICEGIQHAHHRGIIHRDVKPSNVLVGTLDGRPSPKIIDFGVAKATEQRLTERSLFTELGVLVGTPEYMSPEQAGMGPLDVDTRTDIYSLGVLLYELLTGELPFDPATLRASALGEILRRIREEVPSRPSTRISELGERAADSASRRHSDPLTLRRQLAGDLDVITMKSLDKDRERRYGSAAELAADVRRHLNDEPVLARPPSALYQVRKLVARNKVPAALVALLVLTLLGVSMVMSVLYRRSQDHLARAIAAEADAAKEAASVRQVSDFLTGLFQGADPGRTGGEKVTARKLLDDGAARIATGLAGEPEVQAEMLEVVGNLYFSLGVYDESRRLLERSLALRRDLHGENHATIADSALSLAILLREIGEYDRAQELYREALEYWGRTFGADSLEAARPLEGLGLTLAEDSDYDEAIALLERSLSIQRAAPPGHEKELASVLHNLAQALKWKGDMAEAEPIYREALEIRTRVLGIDHPMTTITMGNLGSMLSQQGRWDEAESLERQTLEARIRVLGEDHVDVALARNNLAMTYFNLGRYDEAEPLLRLAIATNRRIHGDRSERVATELGNLAGIKSEMGQREEALRMRMEALEIGRELFGDTHLVLANYLTGVGEELVRLGRFAEVEAALDEALVVYGKTVDRDHPRRAYALIAVGEMRLDQRRFEEAETFLREAVGIFEHQLNPRHWRLITARCLLGESLARLGRNDEAATLLRPGQTQLQETRGERDRRTMRAAKALALLPSQ